MLGHHALGTHPFGDFDVVTTSAAWVVAFTIVQPLPAASPAAVGY